MKINLYLLIVIAVIQLVPLKVLANSFDHSHLLWDELLRSYVVEHGPASQVKYAELKQNDEQKLNQYLNSISSVSKKEYDAWSKPQQLAFLINAYNAYTIKLVLDNYPVESIKDIGSIFRSSWKIKFFQLFGEEAHLDYIEHDLIRGDKGFNEPRIHFAVVCASVGCPKLHAQAYTAERLEDMLEYATKSFLTDETRNRFDYPQSTLYLSSIFKWYGEDFESKYGSVEAFVGKYMSQDKQVRSLIQSRQVKIEYLDYDWSLNDVGL